jgi:hypothetical protein
MMRNSNKIPYSTNTWLDVRSPKAMYFYKNEKKGHDEEQ